MEERILFVDDDENLLSSMKRSLQRHFNVETAGGGEAALAMIPEGFAVVVSDFRMPGMDGVEFLKKVRDLAPLTVRMMLTGYADINTAIEAVNQGNIFRLLTKPCPQETLVAAITAGIEQYRLVTAEREMMEKTLGASMKVLVEMMSLANPGAFSRASRIRRYATLIGRKIGVKNLWQVEIAAALSQIGCITIPEETLVKFYRGSPLSAVEQRMYLSHPRTGADLVGKIPRLEKIAEMILFQEKHYDGTGFPEENRVASSIPEGARILKVAIDFDTLVSAGMDPFNAIVEIKKREGWYDDAMVIALDAVLKKEKLYEIKPVSVEQLAPKMIFAEDVYSDRGALLMQKGVEVTAAMILRLRNVDRHGGIRQPLRVVVGVE
ncbi:MAG: response regulator [Spirochaetes bacterium]|jgi:response regulator RpfG family c-di-GMP phosphodiesterase|nr:response regulator [Spirochaetota bacterium]